MSGETSASDTREQRLHGVLVVLRMLLEFWKGSSPRAWDGWMALLREAEELLSESRVALAIAGAEGAGKSTLLNAILGRDIVMREDFEPGTVAPVLIQFAPVEQVSYQIMLRDSPTPIECADIEQFRRFILQRHNKDNHQKVKNGVAAYADDLLADGLMLLDLPGVGGASEAVDEQTRETLAECHAIILTIKEREWGPAREALQALPNQSSVEAMVVNCSTDFFARGDAAERAAELRTAAVSLLGLDERAFSTDNVFVLHAPSMARCEPSENGLVTSPLHRAEVGRFREWFTQRLDRRRVGDLLEQTASLIQQTCVEVSLDIGTKLRELRLVSAGDAPTRTRLMQCVTRQVERFEREWDAILAGPEWAERVELAWEHIQRRIDELRLAALNALVSARDVIGPELTWTPMTSDRVNALIQESLAEALEAFDKVVTDAVLMVMSWLRLKAEELQLGSFAEAPVVPEPLPPVRLEGESVVDLSPPPTGPTGFGELFNARKLTARVLANWSTSITTLSSARTGPQRRAFDRNIVKVIAAFREAASARIRERQMCLAATPPGAGVDASIVAMEEVESCLQQVLEECRAS